MSERIISLIKGNPKISAQQIAKTLNLSVRAVERHLHGQSKGSVESSEKGSERILVEITKNKSISAKELAQRLKLTPRAIEKQIAQLKKRGFLKRVGGRKFGSWEVSEAKDTNE